MRSSTWLFTLLTISSASPISDLWSVFSNGTSVLQKRCDTVCGYYGQACCTSGEVCYTDPTNNEASCSASAPAPTAAPAAGCDTCGSWVYWTSTITVIGSSQICSTYSSYQPWVASTTYYAPAPVVTTVAPVYCGWGEQSCGPICCASGQYCQWEGQCAPVAVTSYVSYTAPLRPTSIATVTATATVRVVPTTTVGFQPAVTTGAGITIASESGGGGLSGGAIAGIVIGVIAAIILLVLICVCCCVSTAFSGILAFFGLGNKDKKKRRTEETYYHRDGSRADGRTWYGTNKPPQKKKEKGVGILGGILALFAGCAAAIGLSKANDKRKRRDEKSDYTSSYGSYDSSYASRVSSDRRTRDTRRGDDRRSRR